MLLHELRHFIDGFKHLQAGKFITGRLNIAIEIHENREQKNQHDDAHRQPKQEKFAGVTKAIHQGNCGAEESLHDQVQSSFCNEAHSTGKAAQISSEKKAASSRLSGFLADQVLKRATSLLSDSAN